MNEKYLKENTDMFEHFLEGYFYDAFRKGERFIELIVSPKCNLACKYCYVRKYYHETFPDIMFDNSNILENLDRVIDWYLANDFKCSIDIFSGELLAQEIGYQVLEKIYERFAEVDADKRPKMVVIPTNFTFIMSDECTARVEELIARYKSIGIYLGLSASFDGKYMEDNRPYAKNLDIVFEGERDDAYYDKVFSFAAKHGFGFHPMIYAEGVENWKTNFDWFQDMLAIHNLDWKNIYLLQVRNDGWTAEQNKALYDFLQHIIQFSFEKCDRNIEKFAEFIACDGGGFNILASLIAMHTRGIGCGMQSEFTIRLSDLASFPCHRTMYKDFEIGRLVPDDERVLRFEAKNAELGIVTYGFNTKSQPVCIKCPINQLCMGGCIGSQYETNKDLFSPIKSVCSNSFWIVKALVDGFERIGILDAIIHELPDFKKKQIDFVRSISINEL